LKTTGEHTAYTKDYNSFLYSLFYMWTKSIFLYFAIYIKRYLYIPEGVHKVYNIHRCLDHRKSRDSAIYFKVSRVVIWYYFCRVISSVPWLSRVFGLRRNQPKYSGSVREKGVSECLIKVKDKSFKILFKSQPRAELFPLRPLARWIRIHTKIFIGLYSRNELYLPLKYSPGQSTVWSW
jgi:hypothetical protein